MLLRFISTEDFDISKSWKITKNKIKSYSNFEKFSHILWFLGPFILLIERDPADLWLTSIAFLFIIRCYLNKDWSWSNQLWFRLAIMLWLISIGSGLISNMPLFSTWEGFAWIRFPLYAVAIQAWLGENRDIRISMFLMMLIGTIIMCFILVAELLIEPTFSCNSPSGICPKFRLVWPYGDAIPGSYLSKANLSVFCILVALSASVKSKKFITFVLLSIFTLCMSFFTGERINFIVRLASGFISAIVYKPVKLRVAVCILIILGTISVIAINKPQLNYRYTTEFIGHLNFNSGNWGAWRGGLQQGLEKPIIGYGPSMSRHICQTISKKDHWLPGNNYCGNHPHNFYIQMFAETGLLGLIFGSSMLFSIFYLCFKNRKSFSNCPMISTSFIIPLMCFFPLQQFGSFFGQWGNIFIWSAIGFAISNFRVNK